jgi:competence protein ComEC
LHLVFCTQRHPAYMPTLHLFGLFYLLGLACFHMLSAVPAPHLWLNQTFGDGASVLPGMGLLAFALFSKPWCTRKWTCASCAACALAISFSAAGIDSAAHQNKQVSSACHGSNLSSQFELLKTAQREHGAQQWLIKHLGDETCLKQGAKLLVHLEAQRGSEQIEAGDTFHTTLRLKAPKAPLQMSGFDVQAHWFANQIAGLGQFKSPPVLSEKAPRWQVLHALQRAREHIAQNLISNLNGHPETPLLLAMVVGDQGLISPEDRDLFNATGIAHLVAISGLHITLFALVAGGLGTWLWKRAPGACLAVPAHVAGGAIGLLVALLYAAIAGWGVPAQRTVFMLFALFIGALRQGQQNSWDTFHLALLPTMLVDPWAVLDAGFVLSFGAVAALIFANQGHYRFIKPRQEFLVTAVRTQYVATLALLVPCAMLFKQQSLVSPLANALSIPWMSFISTPLALVGGLLNQGWALHAAAKSLIVQRHWLTAMNEWPWAVWPIHDQPHWVWILAGLGVFFLLLPSGVISRALALMLLGTLFWPAPRPAQGDFDLHVLDVGQGTALVVQTRHHAMLYDAGPAFNERSNTTRRVTVPWMQSQGLAQFDLFMLSHDDADHSGGAPLLLNQSKIKQLSASMPGNHALFTMAHTNAIGSMNCHEQKPWTWDGVHFEPLRLETSRATQAKNDQSCVLRIDNGSHSVLITGDIERWGEAHLIATHGARRLQSTLLVVPHHGSKTSSSDPFLRAVNPRYAVVQAGWKNRYGHPHPHVVERYARKGVELFNTAQTGAMHWQFNRGDASPKVILASQARLRYWHLHESGAKAHED